MRTKAEKTLNTFTIGQIKRFSQTFILLGQTYASTHSVTNQHRTVAWGLVMDYLFVHHRAWLENMNKEGWTNAQLRTRIFAVDLVVQGIHAANKTAAVA